jgi:lipase chaperone LimK
LAKQMFSEQRRLTNMMLASQQIRNDARLTQAEKERALSDLQKTDAAGARLE